MRRPGSGAAGQSHARTGGSGPRPSSSLWLLRRVPAGFWRARFRASLWAEATVGAPMIGELWEFVISESGQALTQNVIAASALAFAVRGVRTWRQERRDLRRAELAEQTLTVAYRAKDAFAMVRSPFSFGGEGATRPRGPNESDKEARALDQAFVPIERLYKIADLFDQIQGLRYSASAAFQPKAAEPLGVFLRIRNEINNVAMSDRREAANAARGQGATMDDKAIERSEKREAVIWEGSQEPDAIVARIDAAISELEQTMRPHVEANFRPLAGRLSQWWKARA
jgi:hypothetical protein